MLPNFIFEQQVFIVKFLVGFIKICLCEETFYPNTMVFNFLTLKDKKLASYTQTNH